MQTNNVLDNLDAVMRSDLEASQARSRSTLNDAVAVNPDETAKRMRIAQQLGQPTGVVAAMPEQAQRAAAVQTIDTDSADHPVLKRKYSDADFAKLAHDDSGTLSAIAKAARMLLDPAPPNPKAAKFGVLTNAQFRGRIDELMAANPALDAGTARALAMQGNSLDNVSTGFTESTRPQPTLGNLASGLGVGISEAFNQANLGMRRATADVLGFEDVAANAAKLTAQSQSRQFLEIPEPDAKLNQWIYGGVQSTIQQLPGIAGSILTGSPAPALASIFTTSAGTAYGKYRDRGGSAGEARLGALLEGGLEVATEFLPMKFLTEKIGKIGAGQFAKEFFGKELVTEEINTVLSNAVDTAIANPNKTWGEYFAELPEDMLATAVQTLVQTGLLTGAHAGLEKTVMRAQKMDYQARLAEQHAQVLEVMQQTAQASKLVERSPATLATYMQELADEGAPQVFVDSSALVEAGVDLQALAQAVPSIAGQLDQVQSGGDLVIPTGELLTGTIGSEFGQALIDHARTSEDAMSRAEAKAFLDSNGDVLNAEIERVLADKTDDAEFKASRDAVQSTLLEQLAAINRFTPKVNEQYAGLMANFYAAMAARVGVTPEQFAQTYKLDFAGATVAGDQTLAQGQDQVESPEFKTWFGDSKVVGQDGKPLVVYHGTKADFTDFQPSKGGEYGGGIYLSPDANAAGMYASRQGGDGGQNVLPVYVSLKNPYRTSDRNAVRALGIKKLKAQGYDGIIATGSTGEQQYVVFDPTQIKSAIGNRGTFDGTDSNILNQSVTLRRGTETLKKFGLDPTKKYKTREVAAALEARQRKKYGKIEPDDRSEESAKKIAKWMAEEIQFEMEQPGASGVGWYSEKFQRALDEMAVAFPELKTDKQARDIMTALIAITSDGQKVYGNFRETGKFETSRGHQRQASIDGNLKNLQRLHAEFGPAKLHEYLLQEKTISELKKIAAQEGVELSSDYQASIKMPMAVVAFGPKLGAFYANLMGAHGYLTMDRWWSRTFNRYRGILLDAPTRAGLDRFKELMGDLSMTDDQVLSAIVEPHDTYEAKGFKNGTEIEKAANTLYKAAFDALNDAPFNATDRTFMLDAVNRAQKLLARRGVKLTVADIQAALWYYEKRLYGELGARQTADTSYEDAAKRVVADRAAGSAGSDAQAVEPGLDDFAEGPGETVPGREEVDGKLQQAGNGSGRDQGRNLAPLAGAPSVAGFNGPDPRLVAVAERYAADNGITLKRQATYVEVDPERAARIASAYADMAHAPQDPVVNEAYQNLIAQTVAQYRALEAAGYKFWFLDLSREDNQQYASSPWNAMRDTRANQQMGVFPTTDGFGSSELDVSTNPLLADTGITWPVGAIDGPMQPVLANDLFRAVHDAFGHGLEGAGFRAQGEENAWQAHSRLFTGSALGAITSETRGQNSWLNYGPHGETNRNAKVEDTVFADQKTGLMPEWTWTEGKAADQAGTLDQTTRGQISLANNITQQASVISMFKNADLSTFIHESGHFFLEVQADLARRITTRIAAGEQVSAGEQSIVNDMNTTLAWMGVQATPEMTALDSWVMMTLDEKRQHHESFARGFEAYAFEGKAPSLDLQKMFQTFRAWLVNVYKSLLKSINATSPDIGNALDVELSDEVRSVMDRMLATTEQIQEAEAARAMGPLFKTAEEAGMTLEEFKAYHDAATQATQDAIEELQGRGLRDMQWLQNARSRKLKELQKQHDALRREIEREVRRQVMSEPIYRLWSYLTSRSEEKVVPGMTDVDNAELDTMSGKLRTGVLREMYGTEDDALWRGLSKLGMTSDERGQHPDIVAELFGFDSGDRMVRELLATENPKSVVEGLTDKRMLEEHGDLATQAGLERAADEAIHNEARARFVASELRALEMANQVREKVPGQRTTVNVLVKTARERAAAIISRLKVRDVRPAQYAAAEARSAKLAAKTRKNLAEAAMHKRNQLINMYATKAAYAAQKEVAAAVKYFKRFDKPTTSIDPEYMDQIDALLERFDLRASTSLKAIDKRKSLVEWVQSQVEDGLEPDIPPGLLQEANRKSFKDMTVEEIRGLAETIRQIEHLGRLKNKLLTAAENRDFQAAVSEIVNSIDANSNGRKADTRTPNTVLGAKLLAIKRFGAAHIKVATWARILDGGKDGGPVWEYLIRSANEAGNNEVVAREKATKELARLVAPVLAEGKMGGKGIFYPGLNRSLNKEARLAIALNVGNASNLQRLLGGEMGWTVEKIAPVLDSLTEADWKFVQAVWDHFESYRPAIAAKETRVYGKEPNWLEPTPVPTKFGTLRGGYYPVKYDPRASERAEAHNEAEAAKRMLAGAYTSATTRRSYTKARAEEVKNRPLLYSLDGIYNGVQEVIHDLSWHEWLIDANKLIKNPKVAHAIRNTYGPDAHGQFKTWLQDVAAGDQGARDAIEGSIQWLRQGVSVSGLGFNVMSAAIQPVGLTQSIVRIGPQWVAKGMARAIGAPIETNDLINKKSDFMRTRTMTRLREISEVHAQVKGQTAFRRAMDTGAYFLMLRAQQLVDVPTWWGAYEKAIAEGNAEARSVALADQAVIDAQGSGGVKDQSAIERGGQVAKLFTTFYSFFNTALNLGVSQTMTTKGKAELAANYLLLYVVPVILGAALKDAITVGDSGDWEDPNKIAKKLASEQISFLMGLMVVLREFTGAAQALTGTAQYSSDYKGPAGVRLIGDAAKLGQQIQQGEADVGLRKAIINVAGELLRLPSAQVNKTVTGIEALRDGKTNNPAVVFSGYQEP